jgi:hypothetical protein
MKNDVFSDVTPCGSCKNFVMNVLSRAFGDALLFLTKGVEGYGSHPFDNHLFTI